jgi:hypothetical protein
MRFHNIVRILFYSVATIVVAAVAILGLTIYRQGIRVPKFVLNSPPAQRIAARYGVRYNLESLQIGCLGRNCAGEVNSGALDIGIQIPEPLRVHLNETHSSRGKPLTVSGLEVRSGSGPPLAEVDSFQVDLPTNHVVAKGLRIGTLSTVGSVEFDGGSKQVTARGIRFSSVSVDTIHLAGWASSPENYLVLNRLDVSGIKMSPTQASAANTTICAQLPSSADLGGEALVPLRPLLPLLLKDVELLHGDLLRIAFALAIAILILKLLSVLWLWRSPLFLLLPVVPAAVPLALYFWFRETLLVGTLIMVAISILLRIFVYRRGEHWYNRWEPFVVDVASVAILLPLMGYRIELPPFPAPPAGVQLDRIEVAEVSGQTSIAQFEIPQTSIRGLRVALPSATPQLEVGIASIQIPKTNITSPPSLRIRLDAMMIDDVNVVYDPNRRSVDDIGAHLRLAGLLESNALQRELRNVEFLRGINSSSRVGFDADVRASGPNRLPEVSTRFPKSGNPVAVNVAVRLKPVECSATFDLAARIQTEPLMLTARADGDIGSIQIRSLRSTTGSPIQIASGSGSVTLNGSPSLSLSLESIGGSFGSTQLNVDSVGITASLPPRGKAGMQVASIAVGPMSIRPAAGLNIRIASSNIRFDRMPDRRSVPVTFETRIQNVQLETPDGRIEANFPDLVTRVSGQSSPETIPHRFVGTVDFTAYGTSPSDELIGSNKPISFNADLWKGLFDVPEQQITFREALLSESRTEIPLQTRLAGRLSSIAPRLNADIEIKAGLPHFEQVLSSARVALDDAQVSGRLNWDDQGAAASVNYGIGSVRIGLSPGPTAVCIDEISTLNFSGSGAISRIPESARFPAMTQTPSPCVLLPPVPDSIQVQVSGKFPVGSQESLIRLERKDGTGVHIANIGTEIRKLQIQDGRFVGVETRANVTGIGTLQGVGGIGILANLRQTRDSLQVDSELSASDGTLLLEAAVDSTPTKVTLDAKQLVPADRILGEIKPFLSDLRVDLGNVHPQARLSKLHADANFENGDLLNATVEARLDRGAIASVDSPGLRANISTSGTGTDPLLSLSIGRASEPNGPRRIVASAGVPGATVHAVTDRDVVIDATADLSVIAQGSLLMSGQPAVSPVLDKVFEVGSGLSQQSSLLAAVFDTGAVRPPMNNLQWNFQLSQNSPESPMFRLASDAMEIHLSEASIDATWESAVSQERNRIAVTTPLHSRIGLEGNEVLLDAFVPIAVAYTLDGEPESRIDSNIPIQVAFARQLNRSQESSVTLWNEDYYAQFWRAHPPRFSGTVVTSPIDFNEVMLGPVSVRGIRFPLEPVRIAIGYSDALQVGLPFSGRALYGSVEGNVEAAITAANGIANLDTRLKLDLNNIQAGAIGSTMSGEHSAFVEDELDGRISLRVDGLAMDRTTLPALRAGHFSAMDLEKLGMSVHLFRSKEAANLPGVLQASSDVQINLVNQLLNQIVKDLRLPAPPRAMTYQNLALDFDVDRGRVLNDGVVFTLGGIQLFSSNVVDVKGDVRAHLGRPGERIMLGNLVEMLGGFSGN